MKIRISPSFALLCFLLMIYNCNFHLVRSDDSQANKVLPLSLLQHGNLYLDQFVVMYQGTIWPIDIPTEHRIHSVTFRQGHWISVYPIVIPIMLVPLYLPLAWFFSHYPI